MWLKRDLTPYNFKQNEDPLSSKEVIDYLQDFFEEGAKKKSYLEEEKKDKRNTIYAGRREKVDFSSLPLDDSDISRVLSTTYSHLRQSRIGSRTVTSTPLRRKDIYRDVRKNIEEVMRDNQSVGGPREGRAIDSLALKLTDLLVKQQSQPVRSFYQPSRSKGTSDQTLFNLL